MLTIILILLILAQFIIIGLCFKRLEEKDKENVLLKSKIKLMLSKLNNIIKEHQQ